MTHPDPASTKATDAPGSGARARPAAAGPEGSATDGAGRAVSVRGLQAYYRHHHVIKGIDVDFAANSVTAIIGPSGSGKSTVVRCINRMHEEIPGASAEGSVRIDEIDVYAPGVEVTAVRQMVGMVFQKPNPFPTMSIFDNVAAGLRLTGTRGADLRARVEQALRDVGLWSEVSYRLNEPGAGLSGGQQQRLCIARTIAVEPEVILMDEPCSALDPLSTLRIEDLITELKVRYTIVIVTHNMQQAARVSDSTVFVLDGEVVEHGPTAEIFTNAKNERTDQYVRGRFG